MTRRPDWQIRLYQFLQEHAHRPFQYGEWDCCLFVCDAIHEMTGIDPAQPFRNRYRTRSEAYSAIRETTGMKSVAAAVEYVTEALDMKEAASVLMAHRGDVVLIKRCCDYSLGIVSLNGREVIVASSCALVSIPLARALRAWHV